MTSSVIITIIGMIILSTVTVAFAATLSTPLEFNLIGSSDNVLISAARANVTAIDFITEVSGEGVVETDGINFSVGNEDTLNAHIFEICLVLEGPIGVFSPIIEMLQHVQPRLSLQLMLYSQVKQSPLQVQ